MAGQLRVQSIPAVFAFSNGQPVDGFMGAQTPTQIKDFIKKIIDGFGPEDDGLTSAIESANEMLESKDFLGAVEVFKAIIAEDNNMLDAHVGLIQSFLGEDKIEDANLALDQIPSSFKNDPSIRTAVAQIQLSEKTLSAGNVGELKEKVIKSPKNLTIKFELALALIGAKENEEAINTLLQIIETEPDWNGGKAKSQILELFNALGPENSDGRTGRRKLSSLIFS
jgi:putative thioredoxin